MSKYTEEIVYRIIRIVLVFVSFIPRLWISVLAVPAGWIWYLVDRRHRDIALNNIIGAYGKEIDDAACRRLAIANFIHLSRVALEIPFLMRLNRYNLFSHIEFIGWEHIVSAMERGKGVFLFTAHFGNWELMALAGPIALDVPFHILARPIDFKPMDKILTEIRCRTGNIIIKKYKSVGKILDVLDRNQILGVLLDQNCSWHEGVFVPFFGKTACTNKILAMIALQYDIPVIPAFSVRQKNGQYRVYVEPPVSLIRTGDFHNDIVENSALFNRIIEKYVRMAPDNWAWVHRRWRIKPIPESARNRIKGNVDLTDLNFS